MAKVKDQTPMGKFIRFLTIVFVILLVATIAIVVISPAKVSIDPNAAEAVVEDVSVIDPPFAAGTYGGVEFKTDADVVNYYVAAFNKTKAETAKYKNDDGSVSDYYKMLGADQLNVEDLLIDGKENGTISGLVPGIVGGLFSPGVNGLPPSNNKNPDEDKDANGESFMASRLVPEDILATSVTDNKDGTITLILQPKLTELSTPGMDAQGHMFNTLGDITGVVDSISVLSWASGDTASNVKCNYMGGTATVKIDTKSGMIVEADYNEVVKISVTHASVAIIKDKSASLTVKYDMHYPVAPEKLKELKGITAM